MSLTGLLRVHFKASLYGCSEIVRGVKSDGEVEGCDVMPVRLRFV